MATITINNNVHSFVRGEPLIDVINRSGAEIPQVCFHSQLGPIQTCDTCMVEVDGKRVRACGTAASDGMVVATDTPGAASAQREAFDRILGNHLLYCTVCDNNNGDCTVHNTTKFMAIEHQETPFKPKPYEKDFSNPFYRYDPDQCILCGRCVEACQNLQVNETLSIRWEDEHPRVLWDGGAPIGESSCVSCGHCVTVCPCNALMENSMLGEAGYFTSLPEATREGMIDVVKAATVRSSRFLKSKRRCVSHASSAQNRSAPIAEWAAASTSGRGAGTSSKLSQRRDPLTVSPHVSKANSGGDL
jgi:formate dehydrogenase major subunit